MWLCGVATGHKGEVDSLFNYQACLGWDSFLNLSQRGSGMSSLSNMDGLTFGLTQGVFINMWSVTKKFCWWTDSWIGSNKEVVTVILRDFT